MALDSHIERVLWNQDQISARVDDLAALISAEFSGTSSPPVLVGVATGAFIFLADLVRRIDIPIAVDFVRVESYGFGTESNGAPRISSDLKVDVKNKHVILFGGLAARLASGNLAVRSVNGGSRAGRVVGSRDVAITSLADHVEDIVDTGNTLSCLIAHMEAKGASSVSVCTFLDKPTRRKVHFQLVGQGKFYRGFQCPDYFVVGYGMDFAELYRNLPYVGVLKPECYQ